MNEKLKSQLMCLQHPSALRRRQATLGVFALLLKSQHPQQHEVAQDLLLTCLTDQHPVSMVYINKVLLMASKNCMWPSYWQVDYMMTATNLGPAQLCFPPCMGYPVVCSDDVKHLNCVTRPLCACFCCCCPQDVVEESVQQLLKVTSGNGSRSNSSSIAAATQSGK